MWYQGTGSIICPLILQVIYITSKIQGTVNNLAESKEYWLQQGQDELRKHIESRHNTNVAKNVILFVGDGMGLSTVTAAGILKGQKNKELGEGTKLSFEMFPYSSLAKVYNTDRQVPDSAGTATAFLCGVKTNFGVVGVDNRVPRGNCSAMNKDSDLDSIIQWAQKEGKSTGIVTTTRITHATPAAAYANAADRNWEYDAPQHCQDIASQLITKGKDINVLLGGGRRNLLPDSKRDPENRRRGYRSDGRNLIEEWQKIHSRAKTRYRYVWNQTDFNAVKAEDTDYLLGLFEYSHMQYSYSRNRDIAGEPSLAEMTQKAIKILQKNKKGFFLLVEGGRIDHGHHGNRAAVALTETLEFDNAIHSAAKLTSDKDTLTVVTADHSHVMTIGGYPERGAPILGTVGEPARDDMPYTTLTYGNGPGYASPRDNITELGPGFHNNIRYRHQSAIPLMSESHAGEDVPVYAKGPMAHLVSGVYDQSYIAHIMGYAACIGPNQDHCKPDIKGDIKEAIILKQSTKPHTAPGATKNRSGLLQGSQMFVLFSLFILKNI